MEQLIEQLQKLSLEIPLEKYFDWDVPNNVPIQIPNHLTANYTRNIFLKENLNELLSNDLNLDIHYWIIQNWGGIKSFKQNEKNNEKIQKFKNQLESGKLTKVIFNGISSFSKIASFMNPKQYAIYDSRAIYSLNWLLFNYSDIKELFPQPTGRNSILSLYDLETIIRLAKDGHTFRTHTNAYHEYCTLIRKLSNEVYGDNDKPYKIEMLLFTLAPIQVVNSIKTSVSLKIDQNLL